MQNRNLLSANRETGTAAVHGLELVVVFTRLRETIAAVQLARRLARDLEATIRILVPRVVPYPNGLTDPTVDAKTLARNLLGLLPASDMEPTVTICLCRDPADAWRSIPEASIVVAGAPRRRWLASGWNSINLLRELGHQVIVAEDL